MHTLLPGSGYKITSKRRVNVLVYLTAKIGPDVLPNLLDKPDLNLRVVSDCSKSEFEQYLGDGTSISNVHWIENAPQDPYRNQYQLSGHKLARWADLLVLVADASMISLMLTGLTSDVILHALRCWDTSKRILMLPELSVDQSRNPMWKRQLSKLQRKWDWVHILEPALWNWVLPSDPNIDPFDMDEEYDLEWIWHGQHDLIEALHSETQMIVRKARVVSLPHLHPSRSPSSKPALPSEIWTHIFDYLGDWELATALGVYTHIPTPFEWQPLVPRSTSNTRHKTLEWTILTQPLPAIKSYFEKQATESQPALTLSAIASRLIFRFGLTDVLTYLSSHQKDIFWTSFGLAVLPHKASLIYNSPTILQWWKDCRTVIKKDYGTEAIDGASRAGFLEVLQWWLDSGLRMQYTDRALESASAKGMIDVLEWWRTNHLKLQGTSRELPLKVGKSIWLAAQSGRTASIAWWERSGIPYQHEERVATVASQSGHVEVLDLWYQLKGSKMIFDNQVLVGPTKNGHAGVLQWWKDASRKWGLRVEYKTCDIEEAMEDAVGGGGEGEVREWWSRNGLNLGVGTGEWMKVKTI